MDILSAIILGIVEGLTEFLPVSSTGHLILVSHWLTLEGDFTKTFMVVIQLGAVLAIVALYWKKFLGVLLGLPRERGAQHFVRNIALAFLPAMVIGMLAHDVIKTYLFSPTTVALALVIGGVAILLIERAKPTATVFSTESMGWRTALTIGFLQCMAMVPGVSRSGATIMGALLVGVERKAAAEFSFFLAVPTMLAATSYNLYVARDAIPSEGWGLMAAGFLTAFVTALLVVRGVMAFISRHGFAPFGWYRIGLGLLLLAVTAAV
jgi:undecaprenyl-diphosphatase